VDFWRKPPPLIGFGVERHTLAYRRYHPGISPCIQEIQFSDCAAQPVRAQGLERGFVWPHETVQYFADSFRPIRELARAHLLSHQSSVSDGGISQKAAKNSQKGRNS
jgi:hypothetical protein